MNCLIASAVLVVRLTTQFPLDGETNLNTTITRMKAENTEAASSPFRNGGGKLIDLTGRKFGRLSVIGRHPQNAKNKSPMWECVCGCGSETIVSGTHLRGGHTQSCGCKGREALAGRSCTHKMSKSVEHNTWSKIKARCHNPTDKCFRYYGARGISVCDRWRFSFENFFADMGLRPRGTTIDRIDNDGNYEPSNCRWATKTQQARNKRRSLRFEWDGALMQINDICDKVGIPRGLVYQRVRAGWDHYRAFTQPIRRS